VAMVECGRHWTERGQEVPGGAIRSRHQRPGGDERTPCFRGTRVPVSILFENLAAGMSVEEILETWPTLDRADVLAVLALAGEEAERRAAKVAA
jgi:uncharacterized protein (DUF433 family)